MTTPSSPLNVVTPASVARQWGDLRRRVALACGKSHRLEQEVKIVGITKYVDSKTAMWLFDAGCHDLGESRPQNLWEKQAAFESESAYQGKVRWHFIGHLQRNKSLKTISQLSLFQSLDSMRLAEQIHRDAESLNLSIAALIDVNVSGEPNKTGVLGEDLPGMLESLTRFPRIEICGLMGMAGLSTKDPRADFVRLRELRDAMQIQFGNRFQLNELSMGMSGDFEAAIEEGSTIIRVGSLLFEPIGS